MFQVIGTLFNQRYAASQASTRYAKHWSISFWFWIHQVIFFLCCRCCVFVIALGLWCDALANDFSSILTHPHLSTNDFCVVFVFVLIHPHLSAKNVFQGKHGFPTVLLFVRTAQTRVGPRRYPPLRPSSTYARKGHRVDVDPAPFRFWRSRGRDPPWLLRSEERMQTRPLWGPVARQETPIVLLVNGSAQIQSSAEENRWIGLPEQSWYFSRTESSKPWCHQITKEQSESDRHSELKAKLNVNGKYFIQHRQKIIKKIGIWLLIVHRLERWDGEIFGWHKLLHGAHGEFQISWALRSMPKFLSNFYLHFTIKSNNNFTILQNSTHIYLSYSRHTTIVWKCFTQVVLFKFL